MVDHCPHSLTRPDQSVHLHVHYIGRGKQAWGTITCSLTAGSVKQIALISLIGHVHVDAAQVCFKEEEVP